MTDEERSEVVRLAYEYMRACKSRGPDWNKDTVTRQRVLLFMALERAEGESDGNRRTAEEGVGAGASGHSVASDAVGC